MVFEHMRGSKKNPSALASGEGKLSRQSRRELNRKVCFFLSVLTRQGAGTLTCYTIPGSFRHSISDPFKRYDESKWQPSAFITRLRL